MVYGFVKIFFFPAVDSSAKTEGNFPLAPLGNSNQQPVFLVPKETSLCFGSTGSRAGGDWSGGGGHEVSTVRERPDAWQRVIGSLA